MRTAQRLLDILAQLEQALSQGRRQERQQSSAVSNEAQTRIANLEFQNQRLRNSRKQAALRLETLIETLTRQQAEEPTPGLTETVELLRENAA